MQPGSLNHTTGTAIAKVAKEKGGMNMLVQPTAGETVIIPLVARGEAEFGLANALEVSVATENNRLPDLRLIGVLHPLPTAFFVRKDIDHAHHGRRQGQEAWCGASRRSGSSTSCRGPCSPPSA